MKNLAISSLKNYMRPMLLSSSSVSEDSYERSEPSLSSDSNFCLDNPMSCFVPIPFILPFYSEPISIILKNIETDKNKDNLESKNGCFLCIISSEFIWCLCINIIAMIRLITLKGEEGTPSIKTIQPHLSLVQSVRS